MSTTKAIDLSDTISFLSLLKCRKELAQLNAGDSLEVLANDAEMVDNLIKIVDRSNDLVTERSQDGERFKVCILKGNNIS